MRDRYTAIIVDDENGPVEVLEHLLADFEDFELVGTSNSVDAAIPLILDQTPDIVFLDVQMPEKDGFELLHELSRYNLKPAIIFTTAFDQYSIDAIRHEAFDYLLKPVNPVELKKALSRFKSKVGELPMEERKSLSLPKKIRFNSRMGSLFLSPEEIVYIKADDNYSEIYLKEKLEVVTSNLSSVYKELDNKIFHRAGRSVVINLNCLSGIDRRRKMCILEKDGKRFEVSLPLMAIREIEDLIH